MWFFSLIDDMIDSYIDSTCSYFFKVDGGKTIWDPYGNYDEVMNHQWPTPRSRRVVTESIPAIQNNHNALIPRQLPENTPRLKNHEKCRAVNMYMDDFPIPQAVQTNNMYIIYCIYTCEYIYIYLCIDTYIYIYIAIHLMYIYNI